MQPMTTEVMLARMDHIDEVLKFVASCPASKRGRTIPINTARQLEKEHPGSVCAKVSKATTTHGQNRAGRVIFYRIKAREEEKKKKQKETTGVFKRRETDEKGKPLAKKGRPLRIDYMMHADTEKKLRKYLVRLQTKIPKLSSYVKEAWASWGKVKREKFHLSPLAKLPPSDLFLALLSPESTKRIALAFRINMADSAYSAEFLDIMKDKLKDDPSFQEALAKKKAWPVR